MRKKRRIAHDPEPTHDLLIERPIVSPTPVFHERVAVIVHHGLQRMFVEQEDVFFYLTVMNENYRHPDIPDGAEDGIRRGLYAFSKVARPGKKHVNLMGSGTIFLQAIKAAALLKEDFGVTADLWSAPSFNALARDGADCERWNRLNPFETPRVPYVTETLAKAKGPVIAATDYMRTYAEQIRAYMEQPFTVLGTDGYGRSDSRVNLRRFFEVDANHIAAAAMVALYREKAVSKKDLTAALERYEIDGAKPNPRTA